MPKAATNLLSSDRARRWAAVRAESERLLQKFDPDQPRDEDGKWTDGGGGDGGGSSSASEAAPSAAPAHDPAVVDVGGDQWNRETAVKLESQYQSAKSEIAALEAGATKAPEVEVERPSADEEELPSVPEEWDALSGEAQADAEQKYTDKNKDSFYQSEVDNWYQSGSAADDAKTMLAHDYGYAEEWVKDAIADFRAEADYRIPYTDKQIITAITLDYQSNGEGTGDLEVNFDDAFLKEPEGYDPAQQTLPGVEPIKPEDSLTQEMRDDIAAALEKAFDKEADKKTSSMEPPDYLMESVDELIGEYWGQMSDTEKFEWTSQNTNIIEDSAVEGSTSPDRVGVDRLPDKYDPLNETSGADYKATQQLAKYLSVSRTIDVLTKRPAAAPDVPGTEKFSDEWKQEMTQRVARVDSVLWSAWKGSSTSTDGKLLQAATAAELGGRLNQKTRDTIDTEELIQYANSRYANVGGWAGIRAFVRAKWETTQYLLDKAGVKDLALYRGITLDKQVYEKIAPLLRHWEAREQVSGYSYMPTLDVVRNGAASTTTDPKVANDWGSGTNRIVLRASIPRTAAVSVPAYGQNIHSEHEVVVAGTAWKGWDAWAGRAPTFNEVPLRHAA